MILREELNAVGRKFRYQKFYLISVLTGYWYILNNIKMDIKPSRTRARNGLIWLADRHQWRIHVNTVISLKVP
jgi:hypothetical protein